MPQGPPRGAESSTVTSTETAFALPDRLSAKADPALIAADERHFAAISARLADAIAELSERLETGLRERAGSGGEAVERDMNVRRSTARLRALRRFGLDLCLGRMVGVDGGEPVYVGRFGLTDSQGIRLLLDWRSPAAEPFFGATHANPMGLESRRRYRWTGGKVSDYWDEVFTADGLEGRAALDDQSAFIASLGSTRSPRMRDVLGTIQADQDAIIRAGSRGALVVDGGPGTGKTVVALHRAAYLLYSDPRLARDGVLFVGPHPAYLAYVADVLPSLGEDGVQICTLRDLQPEGATAEVEADPAVALLKSSKRMVDAIEAAVAHYERPPATGMTVETDWADTWLDPVDWAEAFDAVEPGTPHNEARGQVWEQLVEILMDRHDGDVPLAPLRRSLQQDDELRAAFARAWPLLDPVGVVADLFTEPAYLRLCAPWLTADEVESLQRTDARAWTVSDLPLLDAARQRIGDPEATRREQRRTAVVASERERISLVVNELIASESFDEVYMLKHQAMQDTLIDVGALPAVDPDLLAGPFAHIVVDEAQELTDAEWQMLVSRCPSRSFTIVGDRAQARHGFTESWQQRLRRVGLDQVEVRTLTINYRTPSEVMDEAAPVILAALPDANVPTSIRSTGVPVVRGPLTSLDAVLGEWLERNAEGIACVIGLQSFPDTPRVRSLTPELAKGLEFDLVVLLDPGQFAAVDQYVAMTRATQQLVVLAPLE